MDQVARNVYARQLLPKKYGYPLYYPEPSDNLPMEYRKRGTGMGDVGIIEPDGSFQYAFNLFARANDTTINYFGVPRGFVEMQLDERFISRKMNKHAKGSELMSTCVEKADASGSVSVNMG